MQENTHRTSHEPPSASDANTKKDETSSAAQKLGEIALTCALAPVVVVAAGCMAASCAVDVAFDGLETVVDKVTDGVTGVAEKAGDKVKEFIDAKMEDSGVKADPSTVKLAKGAGKVAFGLARGAWAVAGVLGHGTAGFFMRRHNPALASTIVGDGFKAAAENIEDGVELIGDGLSERRERKK